MASVKINPNHRLAIFIDVDGTILAEAQHIAPSTIEAIRAARANGHLVFLSTGRSPNHIPDNVGEIGFDGIVGSGGGVAVVGDEIVITNRFTAEDKRWLLNYFQERDIEWFGETTDKLFASPGLDEAMKPLRSQFPNFEPPKYAPLHELQDDELLKVVIMSDDAKKINTALAELKDRYHVVTGTIPVPFGASGEFGPLGVNKGTTILNLLNMLGIPVEDSIAIGDNWNDIEMFEACGLSIAMGNSEPAIKALADEVTTDVLDDGIYNALKKHQII